MAEQQDGPQKRRRLALKPLRALAPYLWRYRGRAAAALVALFAAAMATLAVPLALRRMIDVGFSNADAAFVDRAFVAMIGIVAILAIASASRYYLVMTLGEKIVADLRRDLFSHVMRLSPAFYDRSRSGEIVSRLTADTTQIKSAAGASASIALRNVVLFVGASTMMVVTSPRLSGLVLMAIPLIVLPMVGFGRNVRRRARLAQDSLAEATAYATELIGAVRSVQAFVFEDAASRRFGARVSDAYQAARDATLARAALTVFAIFIVFASVVGVLWWGAQLVLAGEMTAGRLGQFVLYAVFAAGALGELSQVWGELSQAAGSTERIFEILGTKPDIAASASPAPLPAHPRGEIRLEDVSFAYGDDAGPIISELDLHVPPGGRVAIVGPSGAGKSTLFSLIMRFYDPASGRIQIDGVDLADADPAAIRRRIAIVPQDPVIFAASAADNIAFGSDTADRRAIEAAARAARAHEFVTQLSDGYDTILGERGVTLSGGQRQRIAIARAVLKDAPILLLDEATSALDAENEVLVQAALDHLMRDRTTLVIAHRLATIKGADRIVVMDQGRIVEEGDHERLVAAGGIYARLAALQFGPDQRAVPIGVATARSA